MNAIVSNKNQGLLNNLDVDVIKSINGEFSSEEIIATFSNFFFNRMFLDITAIKDYNNIANIQKLSMNLDVEKIIFLLDNQQMNDNMFLSKLISMGIYNFANNKESLMYLYNHPNTYKDVAHIHQLSMNNTQSAPVREEKKNHFFKMPTKQNVIQNTPMSRANKVIGFKNATMGAGSTTLIYMLKKYLGIKDYVVAIEINKNDFGFFNEKDMYSVSQNNLPAAINKFSSASVILVDLNNTDSELCDDIVYLIEPSTIKLNKMMLVNKDIFDKIYGKTIFLNKSLLTEKDVKDFEFESNSKIAANIPPLNDRIDNIEVLQDIASKLELN